MANVSDGMTTNSKKTSLQELLTTARISLSQIAPKHYPTWLHLRGQMNSTKK